MGIDKDTIIVGFTGPVYSGCSHISDLITKEDSFRDFNFKKYSLSNTLRSQFRVKYGRETNNRTELQDFGNSLRASDSAILVKETLAKIEPEYHGGSIVIDSIRNTHEVYELRKYSNFFLIAVNAAFLVRFDRASKDNKDLSKHQFTLDDYRDSGADEPDEGQQVQKCVDLADFLVINNDDINDKFDNRTKLFEKLLRFFKLIKNPGYRYPNVDELGMNYAYNASTMSRCMQRAVGAAITLPGREDSSGDRIVSIGCNNPPPKIKDCRQQYGMCYRKKLKEKFFTSLMKCPQCSERLDVPMSHTCGCTETKIKNHYFPYKNLDYCLSLHAEENAILQALQRSSSDLRDAVLYSSTFPCLLCAKKIIQVGIEKIVYSEPYPAYESIEILKKALAGC